MNRKFVFLILMLPIVNEVMGFLFKTIKSLGFYKSDFIYPFKGTFNIRYDRDHLFKMTTDGGDTIAARIHQDGVQAFEPEMTEIFKELILYSNSFFDIGANTGYYSLLASTLNSRCTVHSFEPVPKIFETMVSNIMINKLNNINAHLIALSDENKNSSFFVPKSIRIPTGASLIAQFQDCEEIKCSLMKLDDFVQKNKISQLDFMKVDTETTEPMVIKGGLNTITKLRPSIIIEILNDRVGAEIESLVRNLDYLYYQIRNDGLQALSSLKIDDSRGNNWNFLIIPKEKKHLVEKFIKGTHQVH